MLRLILADDEQYEREYLEKIIKESYPSLLEIVYKAVDGADLMENLERCKPHIVLLDIKMPRMDGLDAAEEIRKRYPDIQIIVISAYSDFSYAKQALKLGVTDYLLKPYLDSELQETLDKVIARAREREDSLALLSYSNPGDQKVVFDFYRDLEKDLLWSLFFRRKPVEELKKQLALWGIGEGWMKVVLISSPALVSMGTFSQEVLKNYFHMAEVKAINSIWMDQMAICLYAAQEDAFTELTGCIRRARDYLAGESQVPVACGVSGTCSSVEALAGAYEEAASYISEYSAGETRAAFLEMTEGMRRICGLEEEISRSLVRQERENGYENMMKLVEELEQCLVYQDVSVKLNFGRSLMTILRGMNQNPGVRVKTSQASALFEKLGELNFNGDNLKYHMEYFSEIEVWKQ
ncbi:MAG: response regulator [Lachnospiraceae bacterium]|nr:response regulator [Lachnospiraceae bacterium]